MGRNDSAHKTVRVDLYVLNDWVVISLIFARRPIRPLAHTNPLRSSLKPRKNKPFKNYTNPLKASPELDKIYATKTLTILSKLFPKSCNCPNPNLVFHKFKNRPTMARCSNCYKQVSITANTPLDRFKLPLSYFSYILENQILSYPKSYTSSEISRKLNLPYKASYRLKRRIQIFCSLLNEKLREQMYLELDEHYKKNPITLPSEGDYREIAKENPVCVADSVILFSSSLRANSFRSRRYNTGVSSIYLSNSIGGEQKGILCHTTGVVGKWTFYTSLPLANSYYLQKDLEEKFPKSSILWTDTGYEFLWDYKNHKSVNHSKRSNDPRYNMSRERWVTKQSVTSNGAEARNNILKQSFRSYGYISPKWSKCYLEEFSFLANVKYAEPLRELLTGSSVSEGYNLCSKGDSNPHTLRHYHLKVACLPIPPSEQVCMYGQVRKTGSFVKEMNFLLSLALTFQ